MRAQRLHADPTYDGAQHEDHYDRVVGVPEHRHEVRHQVDRQREVAQQQSQSYAHPARQVRVARQPGQQPHQVRQDPQALAEQPAPRPHRAASATTKTSQITTSPPSTASATCHQVPDMRTTVAAAAGPFVRW